MRSLVLTLTSVLLLAASATAQSGRSIVIEPASKTVKTGELFNLHAYLVEGGKKTKVTHAGTWKVDNPEVLDGDQWGFLSVARGTTRITFAYNKDKQLKATATVTVKGDEGAGVSRAATLELQPRTTRLTIGESLRLTGLYRAPGKEPRKISAAGTWASSHPDVMATGPFGEFLAVGPGKAEVRLTFKGVTARLAVEVVSQAVLNALHLQPAGPRTVAVGDELALRVRQRDKDVSERATWTSSDPTRLATLGDGRFEAREAGAVQITVALGKQTATARVTVTPLAVAALSVPDATGDAMLDKRTVWAAVGQRIQLRLSHGGMDVTACSHWTTSDAGRLALRGGGVFFAARPGTATVRGRFEGSGAGALVVVLPEAALAELRKAELKVTPARLAGKVGETLRLTLTWGGLDCTGLARWSIKETDVAELRAPGAFEGRAPGATVVTVQLGERTLQIPIEIAK